MAEKLNAIEMEKAYSPKDFEDRIYGFWEKEECFKPVKKENSNEKFTIVIPPPNVTGVLHIGHALNNTLQDMQIRYHRMRGDETLWVPGTDHAGIATQNVVEKRLKAEGTSRHELGREKFLERTWEVKKDHHGIITNQLKKLGCSLDWSHERFTLDEGLAKAVREVFVSLYEKGLIYQGNYLVNWCTSCGTALSDDEVEHNEQKGGMYHIYYKLADGEKLADGSDTIEIATTRPETLLGDTAVAVHPEDERYKKLVGKFVELPLTDRKIQIVADAYVDKEFGTGMVKITPAHDPNDWNVGQRHDLPIINILNPDGTLNNGVPEKYRGLTVQKARKEILADLEELGLLKETEKIKHAVGSCYRCDTTIEPYLSKQWFVKMQPLAEKALKAWKDGDIQFHPQKWENTYSHWMNNIRDWCISRQLWWGHRIPVWYCNDCDETTVSREDITKCSKCNSENIRQDEDVLDTWFSSWLWPFSTLGWPEKTVDFDTFYSTTALLTGYDIIFFWVARMVMAGLEFTGKVPFKHIFLHGLVRDKQGRKMSKSLGNGIDPIDAINLYGADAMRFTLAYSCTQGQDLFIDMDSLKFGSKFANKVWNASRYILGNLEGRSIVPVSKNELKELDLWIYHELNEAVATVRQAMEAYKFNDASQKVYEFFWNNFCDWYVEGTKLSFKGDDEAEKNRATSVLLAVLEESLRLLHPFLPFITEEIYAKLPKNCMEGAKAKPEILMTADYPAENKERINEKASSRFRAMQDIVRNIRNLRAECGIDPQLKMQVSLYTEENSPAAAASEYADIIKMLAGLNEINFIASPAEKPASSIGVVGSGFEAFLIAGDAIDIPQLKARFEKEIEKNAVFAKKLEGKLKNEKFVSNAPAEVVEGEKEKLAEFKRRIEKLESYLGAL